MIEQVTRRRKQNNVGSIFKSNGAWFVRYYTGVSTTKQDGRKVYQSKSIRIGSTSAKDTDFVRSKDEARGKAAEILKPITSANGPTPRTDMTVGTYVEDVILPWWDRKLVNGALKPSTVYGYRKIWRLYLHPKLDKVILGAVTTGQAGRLLDSFALAGLNSNCVAHVRNVASEIFAHAATSEVIAANPFAGAKMLESAKAPKPTHKYSLSEIRSILLALDGDTRAQVAVGLSFFTGLRPGEVRAARWENYDGSSLKIEQSVWRKHETTPKTRESIQQIPVAAPLRELLSRLNHDLGNPTSGYILQGVNGDALNLDYLARVTIKPVLKLAGLKWHGYYAGRRGLATVATDAMKDPLGAAGMLRHKGISTTASHYIGLTQEATSRAMGAVELLYAATKQLPASTSAEI